MNIHELNFVNDEQLALRAALDFAVLCPSDQTLAVGTDGRFDPGEGWKLRSDSVNFEAMGSRAGQVVQLLKPATIFKPPGRLFVVATVGPSAVTLRRLGQPENVGQSPGPEAGLNEVEFLIRTLGPQIEMAGHDIRQQFRIDDSVAGRGWSDIADLAPLRNATVLTVLCRQYQAMSRGEGPSDPFARKALILKAELDELLARLALRWKPGAGSGGQFPTTTRFHTHLVR